VDSLTGRNCARGHRTSAACSRRLAQAVAILRQGTPASGPTSDQINGCSGVPVELRPLSTSAGRQLASAPGLNWLGHWPGVCAAWLLAGVAYGAEPEAHASASSDSARTRFVQASSEPIAAPLPTLQTVPTTLSIDAFTPAEILQIQRDLYDEFAAREEHRAEGIDGCMQWLFMRRGAQQPWQAFGMSMYRNGTGIAKINGALRRARFSYSIAPTASSGLFGSTYGAGKGPGGGSAMIESFTPRASYRLWRDAETADAQWLHQVSQGELTSQLATLWFGKTAALKIDDQNRACTHLKARCRRYVFPVSPDPYWSMVVKPEPPTPRDQAITAGAGYPVEMAIEDMCPFSRQAMVEGPINTRLGGAEPGVRRYGIQNNASLKAALRPYVQDSIR